MVPSPPGGRPSLSVTTRPRGADSRCAVWSHEIPWLGLLPEVGDARPGGAGAARGQLGTGEFSVGSLSCITVVIRTCLEFSSKLCLPGLADANAKCENSLNVAPRKEHMTGNQV